MRVLHISTPLTWRGGEQQLYYLIEGLEALGVSSMTYCANGGELQERLREDQRPFEGFNKNISINPSTALKLKNTARKWGAEVIHTHDSHAHTLAVLANVMGMNLPLVVHRRVDYPVKEKFLNRWKYNHPSIRKYICVSKKIKKVLARTVDQDEKIEVIYSGIDPSRFESSKKGKWRAAQGFSGDTVIIANIAAISHQKDYVTWVRAAQHIYEVRKDVRFVIVGGDGGEEQLVLEEIRRLNLQDEIDLLGFRKDVPDILADIDVLMFSSRDEGLGTTVLDAFFNRVPVVSTDAGGIPEMIEQEETGLLSPIEDHRALAASCLRVLEEPDLRNHIIQKAFDRQKHFHVSRMVHQTRDLYLKVLKASQG